MSAKKKSNFVSTGVAAVIVAAVVAYAYFYEFKQKDARVQAEQEALRLFPYEAAQIQRIEIDNGGNRLILERDAQKSWRLLEPVADLTDGGVVDGFVDSLRNEKSVETVIEGDGIDWYTFGLNSGARRIKVRTDAKTSELVVGSVKSYDGQLYVRPDNQNKVLLVSSAWDGLLGRSANDLRDRRLVRHLDAKAVERLVIRGTSGSILEVVRREGHWRLVRGGEVKIPLSESSIEAYLTRLLGARAAEFASEDKENDARKLGFSGPLPLVELATADKKTLRLEISMRKADPGGSAGAQEDGGMRFLRSSELSGIAKITAATEADLIKTADDFYDRRKPFQLQADAARELEINAGGVNLKLVRHEAGWSLLEPVADHELNTQRVSDLLQRLGDLEAARYAHGEHLQPGGRNQITVRGVEKAPLLQLDWGETVVRKDGKAEQRWVPAWSDRVPVPLWIAESRISELALKDLLKPVKASAATTQTEKQ